MRRVLGAQLRSRSTAAAPANPLTARLAQTLDEIREAGTFKEERVITSAMDPEVRVAGAAAPVITMCSNNYLGLSNHPRLVEAAKKTLDSHGVDVNPGDWDYPSMNQHVGKYGRTPSVFKDPLVCSTEMPAFVCPPNSKRVGLVGGSLPVLHWSFQRRAGGWISQTVTPNPNSR